MPETRATARERIGSQNPTFHELHHLSWADGFMLEELTYLGPFHRLVERLLFLLDDFLSQLADGTGPLA
jgi:hypothetical protein